MPGIRFIASPMLASAKRLIWSGRHDVAHSVVVLLQGQRPALPFDDTRNHDVADGHALVQEELATNRLPLVYVVGLQIGS